MSNLSLNQSINNKELIKIKRNCDVTHKQCVEIVSVAKQSMNLVTQEYLNDFLKFIKNNNYDCCLTQFNKNKITEIKNFIIKCSEFLNITFWNVIIYYMTDDEICQIINNQKKINSKFIETLINLEIIHISSRTNFLNCLLEQPIKSKSFEAVIIGMDLEQFIIYLNKIHKHIISTTIENIIIKFINLNKNNIKLNSNKEYGLKIITTFTNKPNIIKNVYGLISDSLTLEQKKDIFNETINLLDKELMLLLLESKTIIPDIDTINKLVQKCNNIHRGINISSQVADFIDILYEYGLVINKQIVIKLLEHNCYINNLEKYGIEVDIEILAKCAHHSYYPYKFDIKPTIEILIKECSKYENLTTIKKLKEFGGIYTSECLEEACKISKNGKVIKYLINECDVKVTEKCLEKFQDSYKIDALSILMEKYKIQNPIKQNETNENENILEIDNNSVMIVKPKNNIIINIEDNDIEYNLNSKLKKLFDYKKKTIKYLELYQLFLKYIISNKLIIGHYFVINENLSCLLKINSCTIMDINQIYNIITYFINDPIKI